MSITIRTEEARDYRRIEEIARDAFWNLYIPGAHEHYLVHQIRQHADNIAELQLVIKEDGELVGAIYYTPSSITREDCSTAECITFGPVFIAPDRHRRGLGRALISQSLQRARELGYTRVIVLGYPHHYAPHGFVGGKRYGICMPDGQYYTGLQALALAEGAFDGCAGVASFSSVFEYTPEQAELFDQQFPAKEKLELPSQEEYARACCELDV